MDRIMLPTVGEILKEEFIEAFGISQNALAEAINVPAGRISEIINNKRTITADTDLRLTRFFGMSEGYFLRLQENIDIRKTKAEIIVEINNIIPINSKLVKKSPTQSSSNRVAKVAAKAAKVASSYRSAAQTVRVARTFNEAVKIAESQAKKVKVDSLDLQQA